MKLTLTDDDGILLDMTTLTTAEYRAEVKAHPTGILANLQPGDLPETPARFLVVTGGRRDDQDSVLPTLEAYLYGGSSIVESWECTALTRDYTLVVVEVQGRSERDAIGAAEQQADRYASGLHTVWTTAATLQDALAETVVVRATLGDVRQPS